MNYSSFLNYKIGKLDAGVVGCIIIRLVFFFAFTLVEYSGI